MKDDLLIQYGAIRETIKNNVDTIVKLFEQAASLKKIVETVTDTETKNSLGEEVNKIEETIRSLVVQTNDLFDKYNKFVEGVFSNKQ